MGAAEQIKTFPKLFCLVADRPTLLSLSMHNAVFKELELAAQYFTVDTTETAQAISGIRALGIAGASLTVPHKEKALHLLDRFTPEVSQIGAANTVLAEGNELVGYNTDWLGVLGAFRESAVSLAGRRALIVGAGGAARACAFALQRAQVSVIRVANRDYARAQALALDLGVVSVRLTDEVEDILPETDLLINATSVGSKLAPGTLDINLDLLPADAVVFDMVTERRTRLLELAEHRALVTIPGTKMLLHQGVEQSRLFCGECWSGKQLGQKEITEIMEQALNQALFSR